MTYIRKSYLDSLGSSTEGLQKSVLRGATKSVAQITVFLSHSHDDIAAAKGLRVLLSELSTVTLYIDSEDSDMPQVTSRETAEKIKQRIAELDFFMVLATRNEMNSRWVPWGIGVAD